MNRDVTSAGHGQRPLAGVKVLDFSHGVAGPFATMLLADLGADVVKIEKPGRGDVSRFMNMSGRFNSDIPRSGGDYFLTVNRGKRCVAIDLSVPEGRDIAVGLGSWADVVVQSFRPGVMGRLGLDYDVFREVSPEIVYASLSAYGDKGPLAGMPGMDVAVQARSGVMSVTGTRRGEPVRPGASLADFSGGVHLALGITSALYMRRERGIGQQVSVSLLDATMIMLSNYAVAVVDGGMDLAPMGSGHPQLVPYQAFPTKDGFVVISTGTNKLFRELCAVLGTPELAVDERFASNPLRVDHRDVLVPVISERTSHRTTAEWMEIFDATGIPAAPVNTMAQAFAEPQLHENDSMIEFDHPMYGPIHLVGSPYKFSVSESHPDRRPPLLGEHTAEVLTSLLEFDEERIRDLEERGIVESTVAGRAGSPQDG